MANSNQSLDLSRSLLSLIEARDFLAAEQLLDSVKAQAITSNDEEALSDILSQGMNFFWLMEPARAAKAEQWAVEHEQLLGTVWAQLHTVHMFYVCAGDPKHTIKEANRLISAAQETNDDSSLYTALGILGLALLDRGQTVEAAAVLDCIESMVAQRRKIVIGDETSFLKKLHALGLHQDQVHQLAQTLARYCRDQDLAKTLSEL